MTAQSLGGMQACSNCNKASSYCALVAMSFLALVWPDPGSGHAFVDPDPAQVINEREPQRHTNEQVAHNLAPQMPILSRVRSA